MSGTASRFGPLLSDNGVTFRLWAPAARAVNLVLDRKKIAMPKGGEWFVLNVRQARAGARYRFEIDGDIEIPDPASRFQPDDVAGPSEVIDHRYEWRCSDWKGRPWHEGVFSEIHVGTFTREGTFRTPSAAITFGDVMFTWYMRQGDAPLAPSRGQLYDHVALSVADLDAWIAKLAAERVTFLQETYALGDTRAVMIEGPSREAIELVEM